MSAIALRRGFTRMLLSSILYATSALLHSQGYFGTVSGEITDPTKAIVPGAHVTLTNAAETQWPAS